MKIVHSLLALSLTSTVALAQAPAPAAPRPAAPSPAPGLAPVTPAPTNPAPAADAPTAATADAVPVAGPNDTVLPPLQPAPNAVPTISGAMNVTAVANAIREQPLDNREKLIKEIQAKVDEAAKGVAELKSRADKLEGAQRQAVESAVQDFEKKRTDLQNQIQTVRNATRETWQAERAVLAADYAFLVSAVASIEVASP
jgi:hypothetical protein